MKIIQNTLKIQKKILNVSKKIWVGPKKVGSVGFPETRHLFLWPNLVGSYNLFHTVPSHTTPGSVVTSSWKYDAAYGFKIAYCSVENLFLTDQLWDL